MSEKTILIANPCDAERALLAHALRDSGFAVLQAVCAKETVEVALTKGVDLILLDALDWEMPTMTTLHVLKHHAGTRRIPVVVFGNPRTKEEVTEAVQKGAASWIGRKGFDLARFIEKLRSVAERGESHAAPAADREASVAVPATGLDKIQQATLVQELTQAGPLPVFEFSVVDAVTTTCAKDQVIEHVSSIIGRDPALAVDVLSVANTRPDAKGRAITDPRECVNEVGVKEFYRLIESLPPLRLNLASIWDAGYFWAHSVATSHIAGLLSRLLGLANPAAAVTAGLLHDLGYYVLASHFPKHYGALFSAGIELESVGPAWEKSVIGAHHGEIGGWVMNHYSLPPVLADAASVHHAGGMLGQTVAPLSRLVTLVVQAADCLAATLFPADPPLMSLTNPFEEFESVLDENSVSPATIIDGSRKIIAELVTEMTYLFPQSPARSFFYRSEPLNEVAYFAPAGPSLDVFKLFLEVRSRELTVLDRRTLTSLRAGVPMVVNLSGVRDLAAQIEILTSLMAARVTEGRTGVVLVPAALPDRAVQALISSSWRLVPLPAHSGRLVRFLARDRADELADSVWAA
ncbi:MAG TPA: HDOD domain-containing protein [Phycisphaerae bacterium]|nr:HDOD domain-containing protein [Phycisphaerae bacterium]HPU25091.1 HDOD domain-containing protein [Phycisphaerae bacterium]